MTNTKSRKTNNVALLNSTVNSMEAKQGSYIQVSQDMKSLSTPLLDLLVNIPSYSIGCFWFLNIVHQKQGMKRSIKLAFLLPL